MVRGERSRSPRRHEPQHVPPRPLPDLSLMPVEVKKEMLRMILTQVVSVGIEIVERTLESRKTRMMAAPQTSSTGNQLSPSSVVFSTAGPLDECRAEPAQVALEGRDLGGESNDEPIIIVSPSWTTLDEPEPIPSTPESLHSAMKSMAIDDDIDLSHLGPEPIDKKDWMNGDYITASESQWCELEPDWSPGKGWWRTKSSSHSSQWEESEGRVK